MDIPRDLAARIHKIEIRARKLVNNIFSGEYQSIFKGRGMEFSEVRPYMPGDDIRAMDWKVTARTGAPFIKVYSEERELVIIMLVDLSASGDFGSRRKLKSEIAAELCAVLALSAIKNNDKVGLLAFTDRVELFIAPKKGRSHVLRLIRELLHFRPERKGTDVAVALAYLNKVTSRRSIVLLVADFRAQIYSKQLKATAGKHDLIAVRVFDPREKNLPEVGMLTLADAESGVPVIVDTSDGRLRKEYEAALERHNEIRTRAFSGAGVDQIVINTDESYVEPLIEFFKRRIKRLRFG